ncbi:unnamed protein product [Prorocentrum cordatum]|uniref:Uncharacterized protein n=1 Tax=Prorocentrum cordatum TaxID=2364126 RepID=A0ABN9V0M2_9DINO|nr:unnamed protein product [Polarella glacialis]
MKRCPSTISRSQMLTGNSRTYIRHRAQEAAELQAQRVGGHPRQRQPEAEKQAGRVARQRVARQVQQPEGAPILSRGTGACGVALVAWTVDSGNGPRHPLQLRARLLCRREGVIRRGDAPSPLQRQRPLSRSSR